MWLCILCKCLFVYLFTIYCDYCFHVIPISTQFFLSKPMFVGAIFRWIVDTLLCCDTYLIYHILLSIITLFQCQNKFRINSILHSSVQRANICVQ